VTILGVSIHLTAVLVSAIVVFVLGGLWYSPLLFGKVWVRLNGYTPERIEAMRTGVGRAYGVSFVCYLVMALVLSLLIGATETVTALGGLRLGALCWLGFAATIGLTANMFSERPLQAYLLDASYQLVYLSTMGAILASWR
jgi:Protein of unknown function (DUF1761)